MYAVVKTGGKQYRVAPDDVITVERLAGDAGDSVALGDVLMVEDGGRIAVGAPLVADAVVKAEIVAQARGEKIIVFKKKRRKNHRRRQGHRQNVTVLRITGIESGASPRKAQAAKPKAETPAAATKPDEQAATKATPRKPAAKKSASKASATARKPAAGKKQGTGAAAPKAAGGKSAKAKTAGTTRAKAKAKPATTSKSGTAASRSKARKE